VTVGCMFDGAACLMEIIARLVSCAVVEGDGTRWTVWTQTILTGTKTERWWNENVTH